jgi:hypothetical protein
MSQIFSVRRVFHHTKAQGIDLSIMQSIDMLKRNGIAVLSQSQSIVVSDLFRLFRRFHGTSLFAAWSDKLIKNNRCAPKLLAPVWSAASQSHRRPN